jgi:hypothetical protein
MEQIMTSLAATSRAGAVAETRERGSSRAWAWLGVSTFVLGFFVTWAIQFGIGMDAMEAGGQPFMDELDTTANEILYRVTSGIGYLTVAALIAFGVGFRRFLIERSGEASDIPNIIFGSILVTAAGFAIAMAFRAQVFDGIAAYQDSAATHIAMQRLAQDTVLASWAAMLGATVATAVGGLKGTLFPKGIGWFSVVMSVLIAAMCLAGVAFPANIPALLWLGVISVWAVRASN